MFETLTATQAESSLSGFANTSSTLATTTGFVFDYNASEFWNNNGSGGDEVNGTDLFHPCDPSNPEFNCSVDEYLSFYLGAKQMPLETAIWVSLPTNSRMILRIVCLSHPSE